jgi:hypothetical protein
MKKQFAKLSKADQERVEAGYHDKDPHEFDTAMSRASVRHLNSKAKASKKTVRKRRSALKPQALK